MEQRVKIKAALANCNEPFDDSNNYKKAIRFGSKELAATLEGYVNHVDERNETNRLTGIYTNAKNIMLAAKTEQAFAEAAKKFSSIPQFRDAKELAKQCSEKAKISRNDRAYAIARSLLTSETIEGYEAAIKRFQTIPGWKDADEQIVNCQRAIDEIKAKEEADRLEAQRQAEEYRAAKERAEKKRKRKKVVAALVLCAFAAIVAILLKVIPDVKYNAAVKLINDGDIINAYDNLIALDGYKDSTEKAADIFEQYRIEKLKVANVGDIVLFGVYEQDNDTSNGKEDIEWRVLAKEDGRILLITDKALDCQRYNIEYIGGTTWDRCTLRKWMNESFLNDAFSYNECKQIQKTNVSSEKNPVYTTIPRGNATADKVFLLSITEVEKYFISDESKKCIPTEYAMANNAYIYREGELTTCYWWLRAPGDSQNFAACINADGSIRYSGCHIDSDDICVRPAMWVSIE